MRMRKCFFTMFAVIALVIFMVLVVSPSLQEKNYDIHEVDDLPIEDALMEHISVFHWSDIAKQDEFNLFSILPSEFVFLSGAGGWSTEIMINVDGTFTGQFHDFDVEMDEDDCPRGVCYICDFIGKFSIPTPVNEYVYTMNLEYLKLDGNIGDEKFEDGTRYVNVEPYGFENADEFLIYLPGCPLEETTMEFLSWAIAHTQMHDMIPIGVYGIYNVGGMEGFIGQKKYTYFHENGQSVLMPNNYLAFWSDVEEIGLVLRLDGESIYQRECLVSDSNGTGEYHISFDFNADFTSVLVTIESLSGFDFSPWGGSSDGKLSVEYRD